LILGFEDSQDFLLTGGLFEVIVFPVSRKFRAKAGRTMVGSALQGHSYFLQKRGNERAKQGKI
jgi:hypothetical protein